VYKQYSALDYKKVIGLPDEYSIDGFLIVGSWNREKQLERLKFFLKEINLQYELKTLPKFLSRVVEIKINNKILRFDIAYGGAILSEYLHLAAIFNSKQNILIGICGGLKKGVKTGSIILPTFSFGDGSTSSMYQREIKNNLYTSNPKLRQKIAKKIEKTNLFVIEDKTMTCQAMLAETWEDVVNWSNQGYAGVEMEASTVFSVSNHFNVPSCATLVVADNLIENETVLDSTYINSKEDREKSEKIIFQVALQSFLDN